MTEFSRDDVRAFLLARKLKEPFELFPAAGGRNNQSYRVTTGGKDVFLKLYFKDERDERDRLKTEYSFCQFCLQNGIVCVPRPLAMDKAKNIGLYEFIDGEPYVDEHPSEAHVKTAMDFFCDLNKKEMLAAARELPTASEACFSVRQHLDTANRRIERFKAIDAKDNLNKAAAAFVETELVPFWQSVREAVIGKEPAAELDKEISAIERCVSPSDFGFHNVLVNPHGKLFFTDFEYAGWDDPAKMMGDFFCQPRFPVPMSHWDAVVARVGALFPNPEAFAARAARLLPVYRVKWCCIMLNEFLPVGAKRRAFAGTREDMEERKKTQLAKARAALKAAKGAS